MKDTVILLDDAPTNREIVRKILENLGYSVLAGENGEDGAAHVETCEKNGLNLVAVISDMLMPLVDGPTFVLRLRDDPRYEELPVIFMTTATDKSLLLQAKELKAGYILKPVDGGQLAAKLKSLIKH
ncbi:N/A [soil metagenome]